MSTRKRKDRETFEGIKETYQELGRPEGKAEAIAARMVSEMRREDEQAAGRRGREREEPLEERTKKELYGRAQELEIEGRSRMDKEELVRAIRREKG